MSEQAPGTDDGAGAAKPRKGRGRPRVRPRTSDLPPEEEILRAAGRLFSKKGFAGTTTREIAEAAGIQPATLFHYFKSKADVLRALSERAWVEPLRALERITETVDGAPAQLYAIVYFHTEHLCGNPLDLAAVIQDWHLLDRKQYREWYEGLDHYTHAFEHIIESGIASGDFTPCDPAVRAMGLLGMCNWTIHWFKPRGRMSAADVAEEFARSALASLGMTAEAIDALAEQAGRPRARRRSA